jgi:peptide/nickel transport system substrate-binding protein
MVPRTARLFTYAALCFAASYPGCRCVSGDDVQEPITETGDDTTEAEGDAWTRGELPDSILEGEPRRGGEVTVHIHTEPPSLNTIRHSDLVATWITTHRIYEALLRVDPYDHPGYAHQPELAAEMPEISEDGLVYTFKLREDATWHDGRPFTARDVIATYDTVTNEAVLADHIRSYLTELDRYEQVDDHTVRFFWKRPYFLALDVFEMIPIYPAHILSEIEPAAFNEADTNSLMRHPIGTGPWKFVEWRAHERIVLERNESWHGRAPYLDRIVLRIVTELPVALQLAERGELDLVGRIESEAWHNMNSRYLRENYWRTNFQDNNYAWIGWNTSRPYFQDKRVRRALTMLIDRPGIIRSILYGLPVPSHCHFYSPRPECDFGAEEIAYDPPAALRILEEAGWRDTNNNGTIDKDGTEFSFTFMLPSASREASQWLTKIKEDFGRAGIELNIQRIEWAVFTRRLREQEFDACTLLWGDTSPRTDPGQIWHSSSINGGSNYISYRNAEVDRLIEEARVTLDEDARIELYQQMGRILWDEQPYTWMYSRPRLGLVSKRLRGVRESLAWYQFRDWWLADAPSTEN